jgi:hypothetical protein
VHTSSVYEYDDPIALMLEYLGSTYYQDYSATTKKQFDRMDNHCRVRKNVVPSQNGSMHMITLTARCCRLKSHRRVRLASHPHRWDPFWNRCFTALATCSSSIARSGEAGYPSTCKRLRAAASPCSYPPSKS